MTDRPYWMQGSSLGPRPKGARRQTQSYITSTLPPVQEQSHARYSTHPLVVVGVVLMATLTMATIYFWLAIWLFGSINPPKASSYDFILMSDYLTRTRVIMALILTSILSAATWSIGKMLVEN